MIDFIKSYLTRIDLDSENDVVYWRRLSELHPKDELVLLRLLQAIEYRKAVYKIVHDLFDLMDYYI